MIEEYFLQIENIIREFPNIRSLALQKKFYNGNQGYIGGTIIFKNGYSLDFVEVKNSDMRPKVKYRYQYMDAEQFLIFRYDNAPHHPDITTFPHHKHDRNNVIASVEPTLYEVLLEILQRERKLQLTG